MTMTRQGSGGGGIEAPLNFTTPTPFQRAKKLITTTRIQFFVPYLPPLFRLLLIHSLNKM